MENSKEPKILTQEEFQNLMLGMTIGTRYFVATQKKEEAKYKGDSDTYLLNVLLPNVVNMDSQFLEALKQYSTQFNMINNPDYPNSLQIACMILVTPSEKPAGESNPLDESMTVTPPVEDEIEEGEEKPKAKTTKRRSTRSKK